MFVRIKSTKNSPRKTVQLVESYRTADGKPRQRIVRYVGVADNEEELKKMKNLAEHIRAALEEEQSIQLSLISAKEIAEARIASKSEAETKPGKVLQKKLEAHKKASENLQVDLTEMIVEKTEVVGFHQVYGEVYKTLGFHKVLGAQPPAVQRNLEHIVMSRIAKPESKRATVRDLELDFGVALSLPSVYRMMDKISEEIIAAINRAAYRAGATLFGNALRLMFYDCTTLYFESFEEDELRKKGFSKEHKTAETQVVLSILTASDGIPLGYKVFHGATFEGDTLEKTLQEIVSEHNPSQLVIVADSAMLSEKNRKMLTEKGYSYIVGARLRSLSKKEKALITDKSLYKPFGEEGSLVCDIEQENKTRLIVTWTEERAKKDAHNREEILKKLEKKLSKSSNPLSFAGSRRKYLSDAGENSLSIDMKKVAEDAAWDGLHGVVSNITDMSAEEICSYYAGLWQIEECFRISKHDLSIRPVYHWTPRRIQAHIAICFMALCCVRYLTYRLKLQQKALSPEEIRRSLMSVKQAIMLDIKTEERYVVPVKPIENAAIIYQAMNLKIKQKSYRLSV